MKTKLLALATALCTTVTALGIGASKTISTQAEDTTTKILCIGDSITDGYGIGGSYRKFLYHDLIEEGYDIDMVGSKGGGWTPTYSGDDGTSFSYDDENCGYNGYSIQSYNGRTGIYETMQSTDVMSTDPDVIILQIGTNDVLDNHELDTAGDRLEVLVSYILENMNDDAVLFVTTIPNLDCNRSDVYSWFSAYRHSSDWSVSYTDDEVVVKVQEAVDSYNAQVRDVVSQFQAKGYNIHQGEINGVITDVTTQLNDGVHPNNVGYKLMGDYWANMVSSYLENPAAVVTTPATTTTTTEATTTTTSTTTTTEATTTTTTEATTTSTTTTTEATTTSTTTTTTTATTTSSTTTTTTATTTSSTTTTTEATTTTTTTTTTEATTTTTTTTETSSTNKDNSVGDVNEDGSVNLQDMVLLQKFLLNKNLNSNINTDNADLDHNMILNGFDLSALRAYLLVL